jgi:rhomboid family GlyGly-CTERM serine protease
VAIGLQPAPRAWAFAAIGAAIGALLLWSAPREVFDWQPHLARSQPWRLWTAAFVHWSPLHVQANLLGCAAVAAFGVTAQVPRHATWAWFVAWPLTHATLALQPVLLHYGGLSGALHAGVAVAALHLAWQARGRRRLIGWAVLAGLAVKLLLESPWRGPTQVMAGWDFPVAPLAHLTGAASGLLCGVIAQVVASRLASKLRPPDDD